MRFNIKAFKNSDHRWQMLIYFKTLIFFIQIKLLAAINIKIWIWKMLLMLTFYCFNALSANLCRLQVCCR